MNIKERAAYAWGRIVGLFRKKEPEIEVEIEETDEADLPEDLLSEKETEGSFLYETENAESRMGGEEPVPGRMTEEYKAWLKEQLEEEEESTPEKEYTPEEESTPEENG